MIKLFVTEPKVTVVDGSIQFECCILIIPARKDDKIATTVNLVLVCTVKNNYFSLCTN